MVFAPRGRAKMSAVVLTLAAAPALAESPAPVPQSSADAGTSITLDTIEVISRKTQRRSLANSAKPRRQHLLFRLLRRCRPFRRAKTRL